MFDGSGALRAFSEVTSVQRKVPGKKAEDPAGEWTRDTVRLTHVKAPGQGAPVLILSTALGDFSRRGLRCTPPLEKGGSRWQSEDPRGRKPFAWVCESDF